LILAGIEALAAISSIPWVGPFHCTRDCGGIIAGGLSIMGAFEKGGRPPMGDTVARRRARAGADGLRPPGHDPAE